MLPPCLRWCSSTAGRSSTIGPSMRRRSAPLSPTSWCMRSATISASPTPTWSASRTRSRRRLPVYIFFAAYMRGDRLHQQLVIVARAAAAIGDLHQLLLGFDHVILEQIGLAEILTRLGVVGIDRQRLAVVLDALVDIAELARRVADQVEHLRIVLVLDAEQERQRVGIMRVEHEIASREIQILVAQSGGVGVKASFGTAAPHPSRSTARLHAVALPLAVTLAFGTCLGLAGLYIVVLVELPHLFDRHRRRRDLRERERHRERKQR